VSDQDELALADQAHEQWVADNTVVSRNADAISQGQEIVQFRGRAMLKVRDPYPHFVPLHKDRFERIAYPILGGVSRSRIGDVFNYLCNTAIDLSENEHYILFGIPKEEVEVEADTDLKFLMENPATVWDTRNLEMANHIAPTTCVWRSPYPKVSSQQASDKIQDASGRLKFIMQLAGGDEGLYDDIMQSLAPIVMDKKPDGVIWWVGDGANGKSTLMDAIYKIFPGQLSSITVKRLVDGRDTPSLNGTLANVVKESSEGRIDDTEVYKNIGTHENFRVHKFHSQDDVEIRGNLHHIFSANLIPSFNDKGYAARRRTFVIPFTQRFESDPTFEERTFTPEFYGRLILEICKYAVKLKKQGYKYKWSAQTLGAKASYDAEASNAEEFAKWIIGEGLVGFDSFNQVRAEYENWCGDEGYVPLGVGNLRRAMFALGFERIATRQGSKVGQQYRLSHVQGKELAPMGLGRPGLYTDRDWTPPEVDDDDEPTATKAAQKRDSILQGKW
jgi:phage/plasmid-associated DNA primase